MERAPPGRPVIIRPVTQFGSQQGQINSAMSGGQSVMLQVLPNATTGSTKTHASVVVASCTPKPVQHQHSYRVKIINPQKKSDIIIRQLHHFHSRFESVIALRAKLVEEFKEQVPNSMTFNVGYFEGQQHSKIWLVSNDDLRAMYAKYCRGDITLWCDGRGEKADEETVTGRNKRKREEAVTSKRQEKEDEVDSVYKELKDKHADKFGTPQLRLWARMVCSNLHDDLDNPPNIPAFCGSTPKRSRQQESFSDAISGAAVAIVKALSSETPTNANDPSVTRCQQSTSIPTGVSPGKAVELRMKNYEQLRYLQHLFDDGILTDKEYTEQKHSILNALRKL